MNHGRAQIEKKSQVGAYEAAFASEEQQEGVDVLARLVLPLGNEVELLLTNVLHNLLALVLQLVHLVHHAKLLLLGTSIHFVSAFCSSFLASLLC